VSLARSASGGLKVLAHDRVTPEAELEMAVRLGDGPSSDFGPVRELTQAEADQGVEVQLRDRAGNISTARHGAVTQTRDALGSGATAATGCTAFGGAALVPLALLLLRRRKR
jgi:hypothetical protein